jgi:hypothetical protein
LGRRGALLLLGGRRDIGGDIGVDGGFRHVLIGDDAKQGLHRIGGIGLANASAQHSRMGRFDRTCDLVRLHLEKRISGGDGLARLHQPAG